ncbi:MAG: sigma 54-interacting transcriptional regulator [Planctomycetota bacterium]|nr:sigma 54-interacting transcriptional regulator [Planctomycetota bacterium]
MVPTLRSIANYVAHFTETIATITGVDIEVIDNEHVRVAGTGIYALKVGDNISSWEGIYNYALTHQETVFVENPKAHRLCHSCNRKDACEEKLTLCTPIIASGRGIGLIGLVCFNDADRERIMANRDVYTYFFRQIADGIARVAENESSTKKLRQSMDMFLKVTNSNASCVLILDVNNRISFINDAARQELGIHPGEYFQTVEIAETGGRRSGMGEFEIKLDDFQNNGGITRRIVLGHTITLSQEDLLYQKTIIFDSKQRVAEFFSSSPGDSGSPEILHAIVGKSPAITTVKEEIRKIAQTSSTVLITGESGAGKEVVARAIHAIGNRRERPFIALNCGAIPDSLLESELFGYVGGAFSGASSSGRMGKFELADRGVLFLDEISAMPLYLQVKLLRVLQERSFSRLGSNKNVSVDIRVIAATNERIPELIEQRMFREDLYYRLNVIPLDIPPLRRRIEDVPLLAEFFLERYCRLFNKPRMSLSPELLERLAAYLWPGNVREFENCIEFMVNMHDHGVLGVDCLPRKFRAAPPAKNAASPVPEPDAPRPFTGTNIIPLADLERLAIRHALGVFGGSAEAKRKAARALGISTATLYRKLSYRNPKAGSASFDAAH